MANWRLPKGRKIVVLVLFTTVCHFFLRNLIFGNFGEDTSLSYSTVPRMKF